MDAEKTLWIKYLRLAFWGLVLFLLVVFTGMTLSELGLVQTPMGLGDAILVLFIDLGIIFVFQEFSRQWGILNE